MRWSSVSYCQYLQNKKKIQLLLQTIKKNVWLLRQSGKAFQQTGLSTLETRRIVKKLRNIGTEQ